MKQRASPFLMTDTVSILRQLGVVSPLLTSLLSPLRHYSLKSLLVIGTALLGAHACWPLGGHRAGARCPWGFSLKQDECTLIGLNYGAS